MKKASQSLQWKLLPKNQRPNLVLTSGEYSITKKSARQMGPELTRMYLEKGDLQMRATAEPLKTFIENRERMTSLFSVKERHKILSQAIKRNVLKDIKASSLSGETESRLGNLLTTLDYLGEDQLLSLLNNQERRTTQDFLKYLDENRARLMKLSQSEFEFKKKETPKKND